MNKFKIKLHPMTILLYVILFIVGFLFIAPFIYIISMSISTEEGLARNGVTFFPRSFTLSSYEFILQNGKRFFNAFKISVFLSVVGTALSVITTSLLAYPLSRKYLPYRTKIIKAVFFTMLFNGGLIPTFLVVKALGLYNSVWALVLPCLIASYYIILMINFFMSLPEEINESAVCDGANDLQIFFSIVVPMSKAIFATIALFYAVGYWNAWFGALLYLRDSGKWPAMMFLRQLLAMNTNVTDMIMGTRVNTRPVSESLRAAAVLVITAPILISYPFAQKYFVKGVLIGSVKG